MQHLRLSKNKREEITAKIKAGISTDNILDDIQESVNTQFHRHHLVDRKDVANFEAAYGLKDVRRHANDQQSVLAWIEEWKQRGNSNPILFYKLQGEEAPDGYDLAEKDFIIVVQTPLQRHMFQQFSDKGVCCDSTHGTNAYDFTLTTLLVIDEFGQGLPVGSCLANHDDFTTMVTFFSQLQKNAGTKHAKFFMILFLKDSCR